MPRLKSAVSLVICFSFWLSIVPPAMPVAGQDLVATDDIAGGSSVFVFHGSRKKPQSRAGGGRIAIRQGSGRAGTARVNGQIVTIAKKRRVDAAAARKKAAIAAANRKIALSNTLTAKAEGFLDGDQNDLAISNYRAALVQNPKNKRASDGLSNALTSRGIEVAGDTNNDAAMPLFEEATKFDQQNDVAYAKMGEIHNAKGRRDQAIANYDKALAINPAYTMLHPPLALIFIDKGDVAKAEIHLSKASAAGIDTAETRYVSGLLLFKQNKNDNALAAFDKALDLEPSNSDAMYYRAQALDRLGRSDEAIAGYQKAVAADPNNSSAAFDLGVAFYNKGDYKGAETAYLQAIKADPVNAHQAHANLASVYRQQERYAEANAEYKIASEKIKTAELYNEWGFCLGKTAEWDKAVARLDTAREMSPTAIDNNNVGWAYYNAGYAQSAAKNEAEAKKNYEQGKPYLQRSVEQDPNLDAAYVNLGATHNGLGEFQEAVNALNTANRIHPNWSVALNQLGVGFRGLRDFANAINAFKQVVNLDGKSISGLFYLGEAYNASGNKKEAKKIHDRLRKLDAAMAGRLDNIFNGKAQIDAAKQKIERSVPRLPRFP